jgi:hypothetical protein
LSIATDRLRSFWSTCARTRAPRSLSRGGAFAAHTIIQGFIVAHPIGACLRLVACRTSACR